MSSQKKKVDSPVAQHAERIVTPLENHIRKTDCPVSSFQPLQNNQWRSESTAEKT